MHVTLSLWLDARTPSEAAKLLEPILANVPEVDRFNLSIKGDSFFMDKKKPRNRSRIARDSEIVRDY